jgi:hypothetical protein
MTKRQLDGSLAEVGTIDQYYSRDRSKPSLSLMLAAEAIYHYLLHTEGLAKWWIPAAVVGFAESS